MLLKNTMKKATMQLAVELANEMFSKKCAELDNAIKLANKMFDQRCAELDAKLADIFIEAFEGEKISNTRMKRIAGRFIDILHEEKVVIDASL